MVLIIEQFYEEYAVKFESGENEPNNSKNFVFCRLYSVLNKRKSDRLSAENRKAKQYYTIY